jgi:hypothetical protein
MDGVNYYSRPSLPYNYNKECVDDKQKTSSDSTENENEKSECEKIECNKFPESPITLTDKQRQHQIYYHGDGR